MLKEGSEQVWAPVFSQQRVSDFLGQVVHIPGMQLAILPYVVYPQHCSTTFSSGAYAGKNSTCIRVP